MRGLGRISAAVGATAAAIGAAVFLHPRRGARNRRAAASVARRQSANVATMLGASGGRRPRRSKGSDDLAGRVREALTEERPEASSFQLTVHKGTVTLRGEVDSLDDIDAFEARARAVDGVSDVNNLLRLGVTASASR